MLSLLASSVNFPSISDIVPEFSPFIIMLTPIKGIDDLSVTVPVTVFWAISDADIMKKRSVIVNVDIFVIVS